MYQVRAGVTWFVPGMFQVLSRLYEVCMDRGINWVTNVNNKYRITSNFTIQPGPYSYHICTLNIPGKDPRCSSSGMSFCFTLYLHGTYIPSKYRIISNLQYSPVPIGTIYAHGKNQNNTNQVLVKNLVSIWYIPNRYS